MVRSRYIPPTIEREPFSGMLVWDSDSLSEGITGTRVIKTAQVATDSLEGNSQIDGSKELRYELDKPVADPFSRITDVATLTLRDGTTVRVGMKTDRSLFLHA